MLGSAKCTAAENGVLSDNGCETLNIEGGDAARRRGRFFDSHIPFPTGRTSCSAYAHAVNCVHARPIGCTGSSQCVGVVDGRFQAHMASADSGWTSISARLFCRYPAPNWFHRFCWHNLPLTLLTGQVPAHGWCASTERSQGRAVDPSEARKAQPMTRTCGAGHDAVGPVIGYFGDNATSFRGSSGRPVVAISEASHSMFRNNPKRTTLGL